jgi:hypothetical protein
MLADILVKIFCSGSSYTNEFLIIQRNAFARTMTFTRQEWRHFVASAGGQAQWPLLTMIFVTNAGVSIVSNGDPVFLRASGGVIGGGSLP